MARDLATSRARSQVLALRLLAEEIDRCADPPAARAALERLATARPGLGERMEADQWLRSALVAICAASPYLVRLCLSEPLAIEVLSHLDAPVEKTLPELTALASPQRPGVGLSEAGNALARYKRLVWMSIAAADLSGRYSFEQVGEKLAGLARAILAASLEIGQAGGGIAVIGMGKLGGDELNYGSDIDIVLVGAGDPRPFLDVVRRSWRTDLDLRPEGRAGPLVRSLESYQAYWERWASTWEFQALIKAAPVAGDPTLGSHFIEAASAQVWSRPFGAEEVREVRRLKARSEGEVERRGLTARELKKGRGGIRDIEFAVQLLQLVHGRADPTLRSRSTLGALDALARGGYVAASDAAALAEAYRWLRSVEHRLQLFEDRQVHTLPPDPAGRARLARVLGFRDCPSTSAAAAFEQTLARHRSTVRAIHERLFFRPLLESFTTPIRQGSGKISPEAVAERLSAFGFSDASRTRQAVHELTGGLSRTSRLMQELLPLLLEWLSSSPDPDRGLLGLRSLVDSPHHREQLTAVFRESATAARDLCMLLGTGAVFTTGFSRHPELLAGMATGSSLAARGRNELEERARRSLSWRSGPQGHQEGLIALARSEFLRVAARDVLDLAGPEETGRALAELAEAVLSVAVESVDAGAPLAVIAMGRLGGGELGYASDLDLLMVSEGEAPSEEGVGKRTAPTRGKGVGSQSGGRAEAAAHALIRLLNGDTPAARVYSLDFNLRPEGRHGPLVRSLDAYAAYYRRWAQPWERQALLRGRFVAGDADLGRRFAAIADDFVWGRPFGEDDERALRRNKARVERERIPAGEDPQFHLKLGRGSLTDVEWTAQLLQLRHGIRTKGTMEAISALAASGIIDPSDAQALAEAYRFCERTRNRLYLVRGTPSDSLPSTGRQLETLARSLGYSPSQLREEYRRRTRRARRVVERLFYGRP